MKIVYQGDIHLRDTTPVNRVDDYFDTQFEKLRQLLNLTKREDAVLLLGGDLFDKPNVSAKLMNALMRTLSRYSVPIYTVLGQHDLLYHVPDLELSPVGILEKTGHVKVLTDEPVHLEENVYVSGASWEQEPPNPIGGTSILLGHISVFDKIPHYWKGEGYTPKTLRKKYPGFDFYMCGDIHTPLIDENVIVSGSMMRQSINQISDRPSCCLIDTVTGEITVHYYKIESEVFNVPDETVSSSLMLDGLVEALKEAAPGRASYKSDCIELAKDKRVKSTIKEIFDDLD